MDGHKPIDDAALDREIESMLAAEPSAEFLARVRARVADEPVPGGWRAPWILATAGALTVAIVALVAWPSSEVTPRSSAPAEAPRVAGAAPTVPAAPVPVVQTAQPPRSTTRPAATALERDRRIDIDLPEVVLGDNEVKAYTALMATIRQSRFEVAVPAAPDPDAPITIKALPPIEPIEIEPIVRLAALQSEGERP